MIRYEWKISRLLAIIKKVAFNVLNDYFSPGVLTEKSYSEIKGEVV